MEEFQSYIKSINSHTYDVLKHNCNHLTDAALFYLVGKHLLDSILKQHEEILNSQWEYIYIKCSSDFNFEVRKIKVKNNELLSKESTIQTFIALKIIIRT